MRRAALALALLAAPPTARSETGGRPTVLVLTSARDEAGRTVADTFLRDVDFAVELAYDLDADPSAAARIAERPPRAAVVLAVGDRALLAASRELAHLPVIYAHATDSRLGLGRPDVIGVAPLPDPETSAVRIRQAAPSIRRVGVVRFPGGDEGYWRRLEAAGRVAGLEIVVATAQVRGDVLGVARALLRRVDALWLLDLPGMWSGGLLAEVLAMAWDRRFPVIGFAEDQLRVRRPATMVLVPDPVAVGHAAAAVARDIALDGVDPSLVVPLRVESRLVGHRRAMQRVRLPLTPETARAFDAWAGAAERGRASSSRSQAGPMAEQEELR